MIIAEEQFMNKLQALGNQAMADLEDITGWWEEIKTLEKSDDPLYLNALDEIYGRDDEYAPVSDVIGFMEIAQKDESLLDAARKISVWEDIKNELGSLSDTDPEWSQLPHAAYDLWGDFAIWYLLKSDAVPHISAYQFDAVYALGDLLKGHFSSVRSPEMRNYLLTEFSADINDEQKGAADD